MTGAAVIYEAALCCILLVISAIDIRDMKIYNRHIALMSAAGIAARIITDTAQWQFAIAASAFWGMAGAMVLLLIRILSKGGLGGGDVKLGLAIGIWLGSPDILIVLIASFIAAGAFGSILVLLKGRRALHQKIPFGPFLSAGTMLYETGLLGIMTLGGVL